jgi:hypothetical protein
MRNLQQIFVAGNYFNFRVGGVTSTTWSWKTLPPILHFEGWKIYRQHKSAKKNRFSFRLITYDTTKSKIKTNNRTTSTN